MRLWPGALVALIACSPHPKTSPVVIATPPAAPMTAAPNRVDNIRASARSLKDEGKLDVAARVFATTPRTPELDAMLADAWRAEPVTTIRPVDLAFAGRVHAAFAAKSFDAIRPVLAEAAEARDVDPEILVWLGRASTGAASHRAYARARARLDELGFHVELAMFGEPQVTNVGLLDANTLVQTTMASPPEAMSPDGYFEIWDLGATEPWRVVATKDVAAYHGFGVVPSTRRFMTFLREIQFREPDLGSVVSHFPTQYGWMTDVSRGTGRVGVTERKTASLYDTDGKNLASISTGADRLFDPKTQRSYMTDPVKIAVTNDGTTFAVGGLDGSIYMRRIGAPARKLPAVTELGVYAVGMGFRDSGRELVAIFFDGTVVTFDVATGRVKKKSRRACSLEEWKLYEENLPPQFQQPNPPTPEELEGCGRVSGRDDATVGESLIVSSHDTMSLIRRADTGAVLPVAPFAAASSTDGLHYVLSNTKEHAFEVRDAPSGKLLSSAPRRGLGGVVHDLSVDGRFLAVDDAIRDLTKGREAFPRQAGVAGVRFIGDAHVRWSGTKAQLVDTATGAVRRSFEHQDELRDVSGNGGRLVTSAGSAFVWSTATGELVRRIDEPVPIVGAVLSADGRVVATCSYLGLLSFYRVDDGALLLATPKPSSFTGEAFPVAISDDGTTGATVTNDYPKLQVHFYDLRAGKEIRTVDVEHVVSSVAFLPNGQDAAIAMRDDVPLLVVDVQTGKEKARVVSKGVSSPTRPVLSVDGRTMRLSTRGMRDQRYLVVVPVAGGTPILQISAVLGGGWIAKSGDGAIAGSPDAHLSVGTSAVKGTQLLYFPSNLIWDALEAPDLVHRALAGELVKPLGL